MEKKRYFHIVGTGPKPGKEKEYNDWYDEHVKLLFDFGPLVKATRSRMYKPWGPNGDESPAYVTVYEFEHEGDFDDFCNSDIMQVANEHYQVYGDPVADIYWVGAYESVIMLEK